MPLLLVVATGIGWGLLGPASKQLYAMQPAFDGTTLAVARGLWALPLFLIGLGVTWRLDPPRLRTRQWALIVAAGVVFGLVISLVFTIAAQHTSIAHVSFLVGVSPVTNTALAALVFRTGLDRRGWIALTLGVLGVVILALSQRSDSSGMLGDGLMIFWLVAFAVYACLLRAVGNGVSSTLLMCLIGTISMGVLAIPMTLLGYGGAAGHVADSGAIAGWFFGEVVIGSTLVAQTAYTAAVRQLGVSVATIGAEYTALAVGTAASFAMHEHWTALTIVAGLVFCCALAVTFAPLPVLDRGKLREAA